MPIPNFLRKGAPGGAPLVIDPASVSNLELRLDAAAIGGTSTPPFGDPLPLWVDTSGNVGRDAAQGNVAQQPQYFFFPNCASGPGGEDLPCVFFNDFNNDLMHGNLPAVMSAANGGTYYIWMRTFTPVAFTSQVPFCDETGGRPRLYWNQDIIAPIDTVGWADAVAPLTHAIAPSPVPGFYGVVWVFNPPPFSGQCRIFINGTDVGGSVWGHADNGTGYWLGSIQFGNLNIRARIFEVLWYSRAHDTRTRVGISNFLRRKWHFG